MMKQALKNQQVWNGMKQLVDYTYEVLSSRGETEVLKQLKPVVAFQNVFVIILELK